MARTRDEPDSGTFDVVHRIRDGVDLELAAIAGAGVYVTYAECATEHLADLRLKCVPDPEGFVAGGQGLRHYPDRTDSAQCAQHG